MSGSPGWLNITVVQGDTFRLEVIFANLDESPMDVTGRTWAAQWRPTYESGTFIDFTIDTTDVAEGVIRLVLDESVTPTVGPGVWDLAETYNGDTARLLQGEVAIKKTVTR